jgi:hypothetical protein
MTAAPETRSVIDSLCADRPERCLGAAFTSFTFDPRMFEESVLAPLLDLRSDPQEDVRRFLEEARARVQECPVAVLVDASMRKAGRRLPYDLLDVDSRLFHPKCSLLLFERFARLQVGSGNLTSGGLSENAEVFWRRDLQFEREEDVALLGEVRAFFLGAATLARAPGAQLDAFLRQLDLLCPAAKTVLAGPSAPVRFLHNADGRPLLGQILGMLPESAELTYVGMLAPFYEEDGAPADPGVLQALREEVAKRGGKAEFVVGLPWDDNPLVPPAGDIPPIEDRLGELWCFLNPYEGDTTLVNYATPVKVTPKRVYFDHGTSIQRDAIEGAHAERLCFPVGAISSFGPPSLLQDLKLACPGFTLALFPGRSFLEKRPTQRPLHAKALLLQYEVGGKTHALLHVGSANLSRKALTLPGAAGNVEAGVVLRIEEALSLSDLAPSLAKCPLEQVHLTERTFKAPATNWGTLVKQAVFHAAQRRLEITWDQSAPQPPQELLLVYRTATEVELFRGANLPPKTTVEGFDLALDVAELVLVLGEQEWAIPILVADIAALPINPIAVNFALEELLLRFGGRWGPEKLCQHRESVARGRASEALQFFGNAGFQPTDVFRAWFGLQQQLADPLLSLGGLRVLLDGPMGVRNLWDQLRQAGASGRLSSEETWFYELELVRTLSLVAWPNDLLEPERKAILSQFIGEVRASLRERAPRLRPESVKAMSEFYGLEGTDERTVAMLA